MEVFTVLHLFHIFMFHVKLIFNPLILIILCTISLILANLLQVKKIYIYIDNMHISIFQLYPEMFNQV